MKKQVSGYYLPRMKFAFADLTVGFPFVHYSRIFVAVVVESGFGSVVAVGSVALGSALNSAVRDFSPTTAAAASSKLHFLDANKYSWLEDGQFCYSLALNNPQKPSSKCSFKPLIRFWSSFIKFEFKIVCAIKLAKSIF
jgi:hypothetical protein